MRPLSLLKMCDFLWGATGNLEERYPLKLCKYVVMATCLHFPEVLEQNFWHLLYLKQKDTPTRSLQDILSLSVSLSTTYSLSLSLPLLSHTHTRARTHGCTCTHGRTSCHDDFEDFGALEEGGRPIFFGFSPRGLRMYYCFCVFCAFFGSFPFTPLRIKQ